MGQIASHAQLRMSFARWAMVTVPGILLLGTLSGRLSNSGYGNRWFDTLAKPEFMPPGWVFGVAWGLLYVLMGLALAYVLQARGARGRALALVLFFSQLLLNLGWSPLFFAAHLVVPALILVAVIFALAVAAALAFWRIRRAAGLLMLPYLAWLCFAFALTWEINRLNPDAHRLVPAASSTQISL